MKYDEFKRLAINGGKEFDRLVERLEAEAMQMTREEREAKADEAIAQSRHKS